MSGKEKIRIDYMDTIPNSQRGVYAKAFNGSRPSAVKAKCLDCCCGIREEIRECQVYTCPLFEVRPYRIKND